METTKQQFETLVEENKDTIYTVCYMFSQDEDEVADLFQESLINLWKGFRKIAHDNVKGWVYRVCLNTCISNDRKSRRHKHAQLSMDMSPFDDSDGRTRQAGLLHARISRLQPFDRAIVLLWLEDLSYDEIGLILGISAKNVSVRLFRIKEHLKQMPDNSNF
jgi:RNA polymerase sigma factor (sigma-70 family)